MEETMKVLKEKSSAEASAWFEQVFPSENRVDNVNKWLEIAQPYLVAGVALAVVIMFCRLCCGGGGGPEKMMKAPGRNDRMQRASFEGDPKGYFRNLRARK